VSYLLDSTVLIDWLRGMPDAKRQLEEFALEGARLAVNAVSVAEVYSGVGDNDRAATDALLDAFDYWLIDEETARRAGWYRYRFARLGRQFSVTDMILAAHAVDRDATLVTGNVKDFPMPELKMLRLP